jgi:MFS family permease
VAQIVLDREMSTTIPDTRASRLGTRLAFFVAGFGISSWAPLVPHVKERIAADEAQLGSLLLCLGLGSVVAMPVAGALSSRVGSRPVIVTGGIGMACVLPLLALSPGIWALGLSLAFFGAFLGALDVAANIHATDVQKIAGTPLMSNFHGFYSIGGLVGAGYMTALLSLRLPPFPAAATACALMVGMMLVASSKLMLGRTEADDSAPFFVMPRGVVLLIGLLAFILFLLEGAILDWSAVLLNEARGMLKEHSGIGYTLFALAMTLGRLTGDPTVARFGVVKILLGGSLITAVGVVVVVFVPSQFGASGFFLIGLGAANLVPLLFTATSHQKTMPSSQAISAASIMGYAGVLLGPALVGYLGKSIGLVQAFGWVGASVLLVAVFARKIGKL